jgi:hypothetical protein
VAANGTWPGSAFTTGCADSPPKRSTAKMSMSLPLALVVTTSLRPSGVNVTCPGVWVNSGVCVGSRPSTFRSTRVAPAGTDRYTLTGDLTIKGTTRPVALQVLKYGEFNDPMMGHRIAYSATSQINRKQDGLSFNMMLDGRFVVSDEIQIMIEGELVEQQPAEATTG